MKKLTCQRKKIEPVSDGKVEKNDFNPFMNFNTNNDVTPKDDTKIEVDEIKEEPIVNESKPIINVDSDSKVIDDNVISDDEFFDDFFGDDDE